MKRALVASLLLGAAGVAGADVIVDWNNVLLDTIRATGGPPCPIARTCAMVHAAMYDAVNSIDRTHMPYYSSLPAPAGTSMEAAAAAAAHEVFVTLFPARRAIYDAALASSLAPIPDGPHKADGIHLGVAVADALMAHRANDGTQQEPPYTPGGHPGDWQPTFPDFTNPPFNPGWGATMPWTMISGEQFRPAGPLGMRNMTALLHHRGYADQVNEVKALGARDSAVRTAYQTQTAFFWANDVNGTSKPPGQLNQITQVVSADRHLGLVENARLFCLVNIALGDAGLVAWDAKYRTNIDLWRPISAIRLADTDGNPRTTADPGWLPLNAFTPPFPAYISGHATFAAAHAAVMAGFFGTDNITFTVGTDEPLYTGAPRTYHSFSEAAWENAISRIYLGVHYRFDATDGNAAGTALGRYAVGRMLLALCPADFDGNGTLDARDLIAFLTAYSHHDPRADFNGDGSIDVRDIVAFLRAVRSGC